MTFFDANIFIYAVTECPQQEACRKAILSGGTTNALVLVEVHRTITKIMRNKKAADLTVQQILEEFDVYPITHNDIQEALKHTELDIADAVHLVSAHDEEFLTYDKKLKEYSKKH